MAENRLFKPKLIGCISSIHLFTPVIFWRNRVVAAGSPWVAPQYAVDSKINSFKGAVYFKCFNCILRAAWDMAATHRQQRAYSELIKLNRKD